MSLRSQILQLSDQNLIQDFEKKQVAHTSNDEPFFAEWTAPWRKESLEHYLPLGWSFGFFQEPDSLNAYFLAQPLLFFRGHTQTLWVEYLSFHRPEQISDLANLARGVARDKHLQQAIFYFDSSQDKQTFLTHLGPAAKDYFEKDGLLMVNTTKMARAE